MSQAPGLSGMPVSGHRSSAITSASCAKSSASPTSRTIRARLAMSLADSIRQMASIVLLISGVVMLRQTCKLALVVCALQIGNDDFLHLQHGLDDILRLNAVGVAHQAVE